MPKGPFSARAKSPWAELNLVTEKCGRDELFESGVKDEAPMKLGADVMSGSVDGLPEVDLVIVGAGLSGVIIAERCATELGLTSLVLDKRDHIGGNVYDTIHPETGIRVSQYGAHLFHTQFDRVWDYVKNYSEWQPFDHRVVGKVADTEGVDQLVPIPPTQETVNKLFGENIKTEAEMQAWYDKVRVPNAEPKNGEEAALSRVGPQLYEKIFKHYTKKQWDKYPAELDASVLMRLPCRTTTDDRYFPCKYQALPYRGYTRIFENILFTGASKDKVTIRLNCDFFAIRDKLPKHKMLVFTGPIDAYYASQGLPKLEYRSIRFEEEVVKEPEDGFFQEAMVVNYPAAGVPFTRIIEYKHTPNQPENVKNGETKGTVIYKEYSSAVGDPYYPVPNPANQQLYEKYRDLATNEKDVAFVGRLASYKYFNMDQAILNALEMYDSLKANGKLDPKRTPMDMQSSGK
ncbi:putative UDP-galactopyranose mutase [Diplonema papillatum]|nr:putative UDP-galactopyranose mutase [Diplonema papillatum]